MSGNWFCDTCGERFASSEQGLIEWFCIVEEDGVRRCRNLRLVHELSASPLKKMGLKRKGCSFDMHQDQFKTDGMVEAEPLSAFLGPDGLMHLLSFLEKGKFRVSEVVRMIKRLHIPGYEDARDFFRAAISEGVIKPADPEESYSQSDINAVVKWRRERT